jgi:hypothetical protein
MELFTPPHICFFFQNLVANFLQVAAFLFILIILVHPISEYCILVLKYYAVYNKACTLIFFYMVTS